MRTRHAFVAAIAIALLLAACGSDTTSTTTTTGAAAGTSSTGAATTTSKASSTTAAAKPGAGKTLGLVYDIGGRGDKSFNDAAARGIEQAKSELGVDVTELEPSAGGENREELLRLLAQQGRPLIFAIGFLFANSVGTVSAEFPKINFAIVDDSSVTNTNVSSLVFAEEQGSYLVGAAAALKSKSGKIGFIGGVEVDLIKKFEAGYIAGAKQINPNIQIEVKYITQPPDFSGFNDPTKGREIATGMYADGADVVYHAAGGSGAGLFAAAVEAGEGKWAIGVDSDQYLSATPDQQKHILTSMQKKVDVAVFDTARDFVGGQLKTGITRFDLKSGGIDYATSGGFVDDIKPKLDDLKQKIIAGQITVPTKP